MLQRYIHRLADLFVNVVKYQQHRTIGSSFLWESDVGASARTHREVHTIIIWWNDLLSRLSSTKRLIAIHVIVHFTSIPPLYHSLLCTYVSLDKFFFHPLISSNLFSPLPLNSLLTVYFNLWYWFLHPCSWTLGYLSVETLDLLRRRRRWDSLVDQLLATLPSGA